MTRVIAWYQQVHPTALYELTHETAESKLLIPFMFVPPPVTPPDTKWGPCESGINWLVCFRRLYL